MVGSETKQKKSKRWIGELVKLFFRITKCLDEGKGKPYGEAIVYQQFSHLFDEVRLLALEHQTEPFIFANSAYVNMETH